MLRKFMFSKHTRKEFFLFLLSTVILFLSFYANFFGIADKVWFETHQVDMESFIVARMVQSRNEGLFSYGGLTGLGDYSSNTAYAGNGSKFLTQYGAYLENDNFDKYFVYKSQPGGQGMIFSLLDKTMADLLGFNRGSILQLFYVVTAFLSAAAISLVILWFYYEFGIVAYVFAFMSAFLSQWLTVFGANLWWCLWSFYLPMIVFMYFLKNNKKFSNDNKFLFLSFIMVFVKCFFTGFEYITTSLIMMTVPIIFYAVKEDWRKNVLYQRFLQVILGSFFAITLVVIILSFQIASVDGHFTDGLHHMIYSFGKRSYGSQENYPEKYRASLVAPLSFVIGEYMGGDYFDMNNYIKVKSNFISFYYLKIHYIYLVIIFLLITSHLFRTNILLDMTPETKRYKPIFAASWYSILAPLSWFMIFKSHSYEHPHMNFIVWQMPFTFFVFVLFGEKLKDFINRYISKRLD